MYMFIYIHTCMYIYIYTYTCIHTYIYTRYLHTHVLNMLPLNFFSLLSVDLQNIFQSQSLWLLRFQLQLMKSQWMAVRRVSSMRPAFGMGIGHQETTTPATKIVCGSFQKWGYSQSSSILIGCFPINPPFWDTQIYGTTHIIEYISGI